LKFEKLSLEGLFLITPTMHGDNRGFFTERFREDLFNEQGIFFDIKQVNHSRSSPGVLRGLHYQWGPPQGKLITCLAGKIQDVVVDIRAKSKTFGKYESVVLAEDRPQWLLVPPGFAHGFCVLEGNNADVLYFVDNYWNPNGEGGIFWNDPDLNINWLCENPLVSDKDKKNNSFEVYKSKLFF